MATKNLDVFHRWAHQLPHRRTGEVEYRQGNVFFERERIYSYGRHYIAGCLLTAPTGATVAIYNTRRYSNSTSRHVSAVRSAVSHLKQFPVYDPCDCSPIGLLQSMLSEHTRCAEQLAKCNQRAKVRQARLASDAMNTLIRAQEFAAMFNLKLPRQLTHDGAQAFMDRAVDLAKRADELARRCQQRAHAKAMADFDTRLNEWRGGLRYELGVTPDASAYLRMDGDSIHTSKGAVVSIEDALTALPILQRLRKLGGVHRPENIFIGGYRVGVVGPSEIVIGCHEIPWSEIDAIAEQLKGAELVTA